MKSTLRWTIGNLRASAMLSLMSMLITRPAGFACSRKVAHKAALPPRRAPHSMSRTGVCRRIVMAIEAKHTRHGRRQFVLRRLGWLQMGAALRRQIWRPVNGNPASSTRGGFVRQWSPCGVRLAARGTATRLWSASFVRRRCAVGARRFPRSLPKGPRPRSRSRRWSERPWLESPRPPASRRRPCPRMAPRELPGLRSSTSRSQACRKAPRHGASCSCFYSRAAQRRPSIAPGHGQPSRRHCPRQ